MPVLSSFIGISAFAESFRNRLAFDDTQFHGFLSPFRARPGESAVYLQILYHSGSRFSIVKMKDRAAVQHGLLENGT